MPLKHVRRLVPIAVLAVMLAAFWFGLKRDPSAIPTVLIDAEAPVLDLGPVEGYASGIAPDDGDGQVHLVNFFASWCVPCLYEHPTLLQIEAEDGPPIFGVAWKDSGGAAQWLERHGDPYAKVGDDADGRAAIDFGITGAPETFVVDAEGRIRYKHVGPITPEAWRRTIAPLIANLEAG